MREGTSPLFASNQLLLRSDTSHALVPRRMSTQLVYTPVAVGPADVRAQPVEIDLPEVTETARNLSVLSLDETFAVHDDRPVRISTLVDRHRTAIDDNFARTVRPVVVHSERPAVVPIQEIEVMEEAFQILARREDDWTSRVNRLDLEVLILLAQNETEVDELGIPSTKHLSSHIELIHRATVTRRQMHTNFVVYGTLPAQQGDCEAQLHMLWEHPRSFIIESYYVIKVNTLDLKINP